MNKAGAFAVVASEVRNLAGRSSEAAREIKTLITTSVEQVESGTAQVHHAGTTIQDVVRQVQEVSRLIRSITEHSQQHDAGTDQINAAIRMLDSGAQQNAALVEETAAAAAEHLSQQARELAESVAHFRVEGCGLQSRRRLMIWRGIAIGSAHGTAADRSPHSLRLLARRIAPRPGRLRTPQSESSQARKPPLWWAQSRAYKPPRASSSAWLPSSTICP